MDESRNLSNSHNVMRTAPPLTILHHPAPPMHATPDLTSPVIEFNRSPHRSRQGPGRGNGPALNNAVPRTLEFQPYIYQPQAAAWQQHPPSLDNAARRSNIDNGQGDVNGVQNNAVALLPPVIHHGGLAEQRQGRSRPAAGLNTGPTPPRVYQFVPDNQSNSAGPARRELTDNEKCDLQQLKEKGDACMRCCLAKKHCDREDLCWRCRLPQPGFTPTGGARFCFRGTDRLWLWNALEQPSSEPGSREMALCRARNTTFADSSQQLRTLPGLGHAAVDRNMHAAVFLTSKFDDSSATSRIDISPGSLTETLDRMPPSLTKQFKTALAAHIPELVLPSIQSRLTEKERFLLASAQSAFRVYNFLSNAANVWYHASARSMSSARGVSCFLMEYCARLLATEVEEVLGKIRDAVRRSKNPGDVTKHAFGIYYGILAGLKRLNTESALDIVLSPLKLRASMVIEDLGILYRDIYGSRETLQDFFNSKIPMMTEIHNLHLSHELSAIDNPTSWNSISDPFHKEFSVNLCVLLVRDGKFRWIQERYPVQRGVPSPWRIDAADDGRLQRGRPQASESRSLRPLHESPDATLRDSSWIDCSTYIQSPTEAEHGAELRHENPVRAGDVKTPQDLVGISGNTGNYPKRGRSPASPQYTSLSPPTKRSELDAGQAFLGNSDHHFDDAYDILMEAREKSSLQFQDDIFG